MQRRGRWWTQAQFWVDVLVLHWMQSSFLPVPASAEVLSGSFTFLLAVCTQILKELSLLEGNVYRLEHATACCLNARASVCVARQVSVTVNNVAVCLSNADTHLQVERSHTCRCSEVCLHAWKLFNSWEGTKRVVPVCVGAQKFPARGVWSSWDQPVDLSWSAGEWGSV